MVDFLAPLDLALLPLHYEWNHEGGLNDQFSNPENERQRNIGIDYLFGLRSRACSYGRLLRAILGQIENSTVVRRIETPMRALRTTRLRAARGRVAVAELFATRFLDDLDLAKGDHRVQALIEERNRGELHVVLDERWSTKAKALLRRAAIEYLRGVACRRAVPT